MWLHPCAGAITCAHCPLRKASQKPKPVLIRPAHVLSLQLRAPANASHAWPTSQGTSKRNPQRHVTYKCNAPLSSTQKRPFSFHPSQKSGLCQACIPDSMIHPLLSASFCPRIAAMLGVEQCGKAGSRLQLLDGHACNSSPQEKPSAMASTAMPPWP